ncbi:DinB family protein [Alteromonas gracilis]
MTTTDPTHWPVEPPLAGTDEEHLVGMLERLRATFRWKAGGLDAAGLATRIGASDLTLGGLLKHLTWVEVSKFTWEAFGEDPGEPWRSVDWQARPDWEFETATSDAPEDLYAGYDAAVVASRRRLARALAEGGLDQSLRMNDGRGNHASLRRMLSDLVEEYGRHTGQADLLREAVDGLVGEDPPEGWRPS